MLCNTLSYHAKIDRIVVTQYNGAVHTDVIIPIHHLEVIQLLCSLGRKINAIKFTRAELKLSLLESKKLVEWLEEHKMNFMCTYKNE
jgi:ribosomal protein L7/L12